MDDIEEDDPDYQPSSDDENESSEASSSTYSEVDIVDAVEANAHVNTSWTDVKGPWKIFDCSAVQSKIADFVPNATSDPIDFFYIAVFD